MCDAFLQQYSSIINQDSNLTTDIIPTVILFSNNYCTDIYKPSTNGGIGTADYQINELYQIYGDSYPTSTKINLPTPPRSLFVPFNYTSITFYNRDQSLSKTIQGPFYTSDVTSLNWDYPNQNIQISSITNNHNSIELMEPIEKLDWNTQVLPKACMGKKYSIGVFELDRFNSPGQRCDYFMQDYCNQGDNLSTLTACGCFEDLISIKEKSIEAGVDLPVLCFGEKCASSRTYKTTGILNKPCNITLCRQIMNETATNFFNESKQTIYCAGHFYDNTSDLEQSIPTPLANNAETPSSGESFYVWIILGVSALLFILLIFLMFTRRKPKTTSVVDQLTKIKEQQDHNLRMR